GTEDGRLVLAHLLADAGDHVIQFLAGSRDGAVEPLHLLGKSRHFQVLGILASQDIVHAKRPRYGHPRRYRNTLPHTCNLTGRESGVSSHSHSSGVIGPDEEGAASK